MVWIHGGSLTSGAGSGYDPSQLVKKGVIVVTINYRLGTLGFFAESQIDAEGHENGNYGFMDQQFALKWVQKNIAGFGGDPKRVTIFGESAGGQSVYANVASPTAKGLFHGAISESGSYSSFADYLNRSYRSRKERRRAARLSRPATLSPLRLDARPRLVYEHCPPRA